MRTSSTLLSNKIWKSLDQVAGQGEVGRRFFVVGGGRCGETWQTKRGKKRVEAAAARTMEDKDKNQKETAGAWARNALSLGIALIVPKGRVAVDVLVLALAGADRVGDGMRRVKLAAPLTHPQQPQPTFITTTSCERTSSPACSSAPSSPWMQCLGQTWSSTSGASTTCMPRAEERDWILRRPGLG